MSLGVEHTLNFNEAYVGVGLGDKQGSLRQWDPVPKRPI